MPKPTLPVNESLRATLSEVRKELLDFGMRNPLLNYRLLKSRGLEVEGVRPADAYAALVTEGKELAFLCLEETLGGSAPALFEDNEATDKGLVPVRPGRPNGQIVRERARLIREGLPTTLHELDLEKRLLGTFYTAKTSIEEQGGFTDLDDLRQTLMRDLLSQVRKMRPANASSRPDKIDRARKLTELIVVHQQHNITPEVFDKYAEDFLNSGRRSKALTIDPVRPGEVGPNGYPVGYTKEGDKVEWLPDDERPGEVWPMILRRNDNAILEAEREFFDVIWYDRKLVLLRNIKEGTETDTAEIHKAMLAAMSRVEKKYGKRKLRNYYHNDFEWGMLNGKFSALRWVMGSEWDFLDT